MTRLVDAHFHLDLFPDYARVADDIERRQIYTLAVSTAPSFYRRFRAMLSERRYIRLAVGLHPELAERHEHELPDLLLLMEEQRYVGEVGLDSSPAHRATAAAQRRVLEAVLVRANALGGRVLSLHSRRAEADVLDLIGHHAPGVPILHWYSGSVGLIERAVTLGCYFSVNPAMCRTPTGQRLVQALPSARVLTETDGPFVQVRGRAAEPGDVTEVLDHLSRVWNVDVETAARTVYENFARLLQV